MDQRKLKILCLHGFRQNKETFKQKLGFLRKMVKSLVDFDFIDAPHSLTNITSSKALERSWWFTGENQAYISKVPSDVDEGFKESLDFVHNYIKENGPFDGLLGFSQGATFVGIIASQIAKKEFEANFKFVILVAGFKSLCKTHANYYNEEISLPSLHIIGETDNVISKERSEELMNIFVKPELIRHQGGHYVPGGKELKEKYVNFLLKFNE